MAPQPHATTTPGPETVRSTLPRRPALRLAPAGYALSRYLISVLCLLCAPAHAAWMEHVEDGIMGTRIVVELWAEDAADGKAAIDAVLAEMRRVDAAMSTFKPTSEVSRVNDRAARQPQLISQELFDLLMNAVAYSRVTQGAFDITYASVGYLYDYRHAMKPSQDAIDAALAGIDYRHLLLDAEHRTIAFARPGVRIDLGGIGKGHAVDRGIDVLRRRGIQRALITAGGDSRIIGDRFGAPWVVGIRHPDRNEVIARIPLEDVALSTSGDYERYFEAGGQRHHHILDPRTGQAASKVRSATLIGPTATLTDGLSKTAFILGPQEALALYNSMEDVDAILITPEGEVLYTDGLLAADD